MKRKLDENLQHLNFALTGASGYVGTRLLARLSEMGAAASVLVREPALNDLEISSRHSVITGELSDPESLKRLVADADVVVHLAAYVHKPTHTSAQKAECYQVNYEGTKKLLDACLTCENPPFVVLFSTVSVYGKKDDPFQEEMNCEPETTYGETKLLAERYFQELQKTTYLRGCILRPSAIIGPEAPGNLLQLVKLIKSGIFPYFNGGRNRKSLTPVENVLDGAMLVIRNQEASGGEIYNLSNKEPVTLFEMGMIVAEGLGKKPISINLPQKPFFWAGSILDGILQLFGTGTRSFVRRLKVYTSEDVVSTKKINNELEYHPKISIEEGLKRMAAVYRE